MKKIVILCIVVIAGTFGFFKLSELANTKLNTMYYLASNSNGYFDERKDSVVLCQEKVPVKMRNMHSYTQLPVHCIDFFL